MLAAMLPLSAATGGAPKGKAVGNPAAPILIEVYSDFECPACRQWHLQLLPLLMRDYVNAGKAYIVFHDISNHPHSNEATGYALAAASVGKYSDVADALYEHQTEWAANGKVWQTVAVALNPAEQKKVAALAKEPSVVAEVTAETDFGRTKAQKTPTMIVINKMKQYKFEGTPNYSLLSGFFNDLLAK